MKLIAAVETIGVEDAQVAEALAVIGENRRERSRRLARCRTGRYTGRRSEQCP